MKHCLNKRIKYNAWLPQTDEQENFPSKLQKGNKDKQEKPKNRTYARRRPFIKHETYQDYINYLFKEEE